MALRREKYGGQVSEENQKRGQHGASLDLSISSIPLGERAWKIPSFPAHYKLQGFHLIGATIKKVNWMAQYFSLKVHVISCVNVNIDCYFLRDDFFKIDFFYILYFSLQK